MPSADMEPSPWTRPAVPSSLSNRVAAKREAWRGAARAWLGPIVSTDYQRMHAERLFPLVQAAIGLALAYALGELVVFGFSTSVVRGVVYLVIVAPAVLVLGLALVRIGLAFTLALVRIADDLEELGELPRWVRGLSPRRMLWPAGTLDNRREPRGGDGNRGRSA